jgi:hypothetical protein
MAFLGTSSRNGLAELAAIHLLRSRTHPPEACPHFFRRKPEYFYNHLIDGVFGFFGSLILNPKRKCDLVFDHIKRIEAIQSGATPSYKHELLARSLTLQVLQSNHDPKNNQKAHPLALFWATRYVGQIYGRSLYSAVLSEKISINWLKTVFGLEPNVEENLTSRSSILTFQTLCRQLDSIDWSASKNDLL